MNTSYPNFYDIYFQRFTAELFQDRLHWHWMKAQGLVESNLNPEAISPVGAMGVMQLMPNTAAEMVKKTGVGVIDSSGGTIMEPHINIFLGIAYDRRCFDIWKAEEGRERIRFMLGSYNAGAGHIVTAQTLAGQRRMATNQWQSIVATLPEVTGKHAIETINYVNRIEHHFDRLAAMETKQ